MIEVINIRYKNLTEYEKKYILPYMEAPEENNNVRKGEAAITSRTKIINSQDTENLPDNVALDDDELTEEDLEGLENVDMNEDEEDPPQEEDNNQNDQNQDTQDTNTENPTEDNGDTATEDTGDTATEDNGENQTDNTEEIALDEGDDQEEDQNNDDGNTNDDEEIALDEEDNDTDQGTEDDQNNDDGNTDDQGEGIHKQNLYHKFMNLHDSIERYIDKLDGLTGSTDSMNHQIAVINDKFKDLESLIYQYMILKFKKNSYVESMLFYQRAVAAVNLTLEVLSNVWKDPDINDKSN